MPIIIPAISTEVVPGARHSRKFSHSCQYETFLRAFFGDGTRIPCIVVSAYNKPGYISHVYTDHVSIDKFIERNWSLPPITSRSRDNFPNPVTAPNDPYVPTNGPAIGDLWDMFTFSSSDTD